MEFQGRYLNVVDVEATCWSGAAPPAMASEIIEVGLDAWNIAALVLWLMDKSVLEV